MDWGAGIYFLGIVAFVLLYAIIVAVGNHRKQKKLKQARQTEAEEAGLDFQEEDQDFENWLNDNGFDFGQSHSIFPSSKVRNILRGSRDEADFAQFHYSFRVGGGEGSHGVNREITLLTLKGNSVPDFEIHKKGFYFLDFRGNKIPLKTEFGENLQLYGEESEAVKMLFTPDVQECFLGFQLEQAEMCFPYFILAAAENPNITSNSYIQTAFEILEILRKSNKNNPSIPESNDDGLYRIDVEAEKQRMFGNQNNDSELPHRSDNERGSTNTADVSSIVQTKEQPGEKEYCLNCGELIRVGTPICPYCNLDSEERTRRFEQERGYIKIRKWLISHHGHHGGK